MTTHQLLIDDSLLKTIALAVARNRVGANVPVEEILAGECVAPEEFSVLLDDPVFQGYVKRYCKEMTENGVSIQLKSRELFENSLPYVFHIVSDPDAPAMARLKGTEVLAKYGGLDKELAVPATGNTGFNITFNIPTLDNPGQASITIENAPAATTTHQHALIEADFYEVETLAAA